MEWLPTSILSREARFAYVASGFRLAEIYVPFVRHTDGRIQAKWQPVPFASEPPLEPSTPASRSPEGSASQLHPQAALHLPVEDGREREQVVHLQRVAAAHRPRQEQDRFLKVGR